MPRKVTLLQLKFLEEEREKQKQNKSIDQYIQECRSAKRTKNASMLDAISALREVRKIMGEHDLHATLLDVIEKVNEKKKK